MQTVKSDTTKDLTMLKLQIAKTQSLQNYNENFEQKKKSKAHHPSVYFFKMFLKHDLWNILLNTLSMFKFI